MHYKRASKNKLREIEIKKITQRNTKDKESDDNKLIVVDR